MTSGVRALMAALAVAVTAGCSQSPTSPTDPADGAPASPVTFTYPGVVGPGGSVSRSFVATRPGAAIITLSGIAPATGLGVGLGIPRPDGTGCLIARSAIAADGASAEVSAAVDAGSYCAQVFAPATAADQVAFSVTLVHP
jgi:hypothetical protein